MAREFGHRMALCGPKKFLEFIITSSMKDMDPSKLAKMVPKILYGRLFEIGKQFIENFPDRRAKIFSLFREIDETVVVLQHLYLPLIQKHQNNFLCEFWIFEELSKIFEKISDIEYSLLRELLEIILDLNDEILRDLFQMPRNVRTVISSICRKIIDSENEINISKYFWLSTCCLPIAKLPESVFR